jgi:signal transduction histidine kinase
LAEALQDYSQRIDNLINRERQFTSDASHELRTPVTIIDGAVQIMLADNNIQGKSRERLTMIRRATGDLSELIRVFFLLARESELNSDNRPYLLSEMVPVELDKLRPLLEGGQVTLDYLEQGQWETTVPAQVVAIILNNLVRNAINYTERGAVTVTLKNREIIVQDTGKGIEPDLLNNIFERHVRGRGNSKAGEGLGMAIVKRLVDQFYLELDITNLQPNGLKVVLREAEKKAS